MSMWKKALKIFIEVAAWVISSAVFGTVLGVISWLILPEEKFSIQGRWMGVFIFVAILLLAIIVRLVIMLAKRESIKVNNIIRTVASGSRLICLLKFSPEFSHGTLTSIYHTDADGFEILIGLGHVLIIQENKNIQVQIDYGVNPYRDLIDGLRRNDLTVLKRVTLKPNVPMCDESDLYTIGDEYGEQ